MRHACRRANRPLAQTADRVRRVALLLSNADLVTHPPATSLLLHWRYQRLGQRCEICCNVQRPRATDRRWAKLEFLNKQREDRDIQEILDTLEWAVLLAGFHPAD
jgi:hypothetical protein